MAVITDNSDKSWVYPYYPYRYYGPHRETSTEEDDPDMPAFDWVGTEWTPEPSDSESEAGFDVAKTLLSVIDSLSEEQAGDKTLTVSLSIFSS
jgi:hypothetical protein